LTGYAFEHEAHVGIRSRYLNFVLQPTHTHTQDKTEDILLLNMLVIATYRTQLSLENLSKYICELLNQRFVFAAQLE
jgi:hypothetical protein